MQRMNNKQQCARSERPTNNKTQKRQKKEKTNNNNNYKVFGYLSNDLSVFAECAQANRARRRARDCSVRCDHCMFSLANSFLFIPFSNSNSCALISFRFIYFPFLFTLCGAPYVCIVLLRLRRAGMRVNELVMFSSRAHCINAAALSAVHVLCDLWSHRNRGRQRNRLWISQLHFVVSVNSKSVFHPFVLLSLGAQLIRIIVFMFDLRHKSWTACCILRSLHRIHWSGPRNKSAADRKKKKKKTIFIIVKNEMRGMWNFKRSHDAKVFDWTRAPSPAGCCRFPFSLCGDLSSTLCFQYEPIEMNVLSLLNSL